MLSSHRARRRGDRPSLFKGLDKLRSHADADELWSGHALANAGLFKTSRIGIVYMWLGTPVMKLTRGNFVRLTVGAAASLAFSRVTLAESYPSRPTR
jgi:hypothetical protein